MPFLMFRHILGKFLFEKMCLELKTALKNVLKNVPGGIFADSKNICKSI